MHVATEAAPYGGNIKHPKPCSCVSSLPAAGKIRGLTVWVVIKPFACLRHIMLQPAAASLSLPHQHGTAVLTADVTALHVLMILKSSPENIIEKSHKAPRH